LNSNHYILIINPANGAPAQAIGLPHPALHSRVGAQKVPQVVPHHQSACVQHPPRPLLIQVNLPHNT
jgi:hypothetical protein